MRPAIMTAQESSKPKSERPPAGRNVAREVGGAHDEHAHADAHGQNVEGLLERNLGGGEEGADGDAEAHDGLHDGTLREIHAERVVAPFENEELKHCACAPEERRDGEGDLTETVAPEKTAALDEALDGVDGVELLRGIAHARVGNGEVDGRGGEVDEGDCEDGGLGKARQAESIKMEQIEDGLCDLRLDENTAEHNAENDGTNREALDPAVGDNELLRREKSVRMPYFAGE